MLGTFNKLSGWKIHTQKGIKRRIFVKIGVILAGLHLIGYKFEEKLHKMNQFKTDFSTEKLRRSAVKIRFMG